MAMLHRVMRPSMDRASTPSPANSSTNPTPPAAPIWPMMCRIKSFAATPAGNLPATLINMFSDFFATMVWVANTCSTSEVPMPKAKAPRAPLVVVWESPHTTVMPGKQAPCSGPTTWTMPWRSSNSSM